MVIALALALFVQDPIRVELSHEQFEMGDRARVYVRAAQDGYLVILHADPAGRVRVIFPLDPSDDNFIRGDRKFEVRGRGDRDAFQAEGDGSGTVIAAVSPDPFRFDEFARNGHWDFRSLGGPSSEVTNDPPAKLLDIVQRMSPDSSARFEYDQATYVVQSTQYAADYGHGYGSHFMIGLSFGFPYYAPYGAWGYGAWGYGAWGYPYGYGSFYRPVPYRPVVFGAFGTSRFVKPARQFVTPIQVRPRTIVGTPASSRNRIEPRTSRSVPRFLSGLFGGNKGGGGSSRPSISRSLGGRGFGAVSARPMSRGSFGGFRGIGGRRH
jgi:hypothetical protein